MNVMNIPMRCLLTALLLGVGTGAGAQLELRTEAQLSASGGDHTPLWLNANKYGLSSLDRTNGYVRAGLFRPLQLDSARRWGWGAGADVAVAGGYTSTLVVQQAYGELRWLKGLLTVGSKEQPMELHNQTLSSGPQTLGVNARPVPGVRLAMPVYWDVPGLREGLHPAVRALRLLRFATRRRVRGRAVCARIAHHPRAGGRDCGRSGDDRACRRGLSRDARL